MSRQTTRNVSITKSGVIARELMDKMIEEQEKNKTNETIFESVDEQDNKLLDELFSKYVNETSKRVIPEFFVKWYPVIDVPSDLKIICTYYSTKINDFTFDGSDAFIEVILTDKYCHPYFDFDHIESNEQYTSVITWFDSLVSEFGQYSIGGYSNDSKICATHNLKYITDAAKRISIHVVFYEKRILQQDMMEIVQKVGNQNTRRFAYDINEFVDDSVYKLKHVSKSSRQIFRHILSNKNYRGKESIYIAGQLCKPNDQPFNQIIQCIQDDSSTDDVISNWSNVIHKLPSLKEKEKEKTNAKGLVDVDNGVAEVAGDGKLITKTHVKNIKIDDVDFDDNLIVFNKEQMMGLLNKFETTFENLEKTTAPIRYSNHTEEFVKECYTEWYNQRTHNHNVDETINKIMKYFKQEFTNKWFYSINKHLDSIDQQRYKNEHKHLFVDKTININESEYDIIDVKARQYKISDFNQLINDLREVVRVKDGACYIKIRDRRQFKIVMKSEEQMMNYFKFDKPFINVNSINLGQIINKYSKAFRYNEVTFQEKNKEGCINMFTGFAYKEIQTNDFTQIQPFLNHVKNVLGGKVDTEQNYEYIIKWFASIFQQVKLKIGTMMNFIGQQGCGKSFSIETIYELLGIFALKNVDELSKIFGKFNALAATAILINFNEIQDATDSFNLQHKMKSAITQASGIIERKGVDSVENEIWINFTCTCNDVNAIPAEKGNRKFQYFTCKNEFADKREYFQNLCKDIQPQKQGEYNEEFMGILLHYFRTLDIQGFDAEDSIVQASRNTNVIYNEQLERQYTGLNQVDRFVVDNFPIFEIGVPIQCIKIDKYQLTE
ncbi:MAG: hypothetical protein EZS28_023486 [Streblomastix strix]|uniref:NrS-1 polymerase-like helicase domain-containing protein n=1 Tax=Streblomastix strix TaxID=222440 RepID=A0A5J4VEZ9_9EUKA|nr:MAG: hypothetical protein EZS28_023486 [Streblomastix strix]